MQLVMVRATLENLPSVRLPEGYDLRHFRLGDEPAWERVMTESFGEKDPPWSFADTLGSDAACSPERVLFITRDDVPVATASAWYRPQWGRDTGYVHFVGTSTAHQGRKLGYWVSLAVLQRFVCEGRTRALLQTDDFRVPAIKTYLQLGFRPWLVEENQRDRWRVIITTNGLAALCPDWEALVNGPMHDPAG